MHAGVLIRKSVASVTGNVRLETVNIGQFFTLQTARTEPLIPPQSAALSFGSGETAVFLLNRLLLAVRLQLKQRKRRLQHSAGAPLMFLGAGEEEAEMDCNYVFLCGVMWCRFGQQDAGKELLRATNSVDPDMKALAWAMLAKGARRLRDLERPTPPGSPAILEGNLCG